MKIHVTWQGVDGSTWALAGEKPGRSGVILVRPTGFVAKAEETTRRNSTGVGVQVTKRTYPALSGSLELRVHGRSGDVWAEFMRSFSVTTPGRLVVSDTQASVWEISARLSADVDPPEYSPTGSMPAVSVTVPLVCDEGLWASPVRTYTGASTVAHTITNNGDVSTYPTIRWTGSGRSVVMPSGQRVALPTVSAWRRLSTDPGTGFAVTDDAGASDAVTWAAFRGLSINGEIPPGASAQFVGSVATEVSFETRDFVRSPWR